MRVSVDSWQPPPHKGVIPIWGPERVEAVNTEKCPKCGAEPMRMCVYVQVPVPQGYSRGGPAVERYQRSGTPTKVPHHERAEALRARKRKERQRAERKSLEKRRAAMKPSDETLEAVRAMRQYDLAEHEKLRAWVQEYGDILVNANQLRPDGTTRGESYAANCDTGLP